MKVIFVINEPIQKASGGYKMVYIYANELARKNNDVTIIYHCRRDKLLSNYKFPFPFKFLIAKFLAYRGPNWFDLEKMVHRKVVKEITNKTIPDCDVILATAADTAEDVNSLSQSKGRKYYFIQGYENWVLPEKKLIETYQFPMKKIVVAKWLKKTVESFTKGQEVECVLNGIDDNIFKIFEPIEQRIPASICMLYHDLEQKGSKEGLMVINKLKKIIPDLKVHLFGIVPRPVDLPSWINYTYRANAQEVVKIYNASSIYLCPSWNEGCSLTGAESMMCGCALVSTKIKGIQEYADDTNSILVDVHDIEAMYSASINLIRCNEERIRIAQKGFQQIKELLNYKRCIQQFIELLYDDTNQLNNKVI